MLGEGRNALHCLRHHQCSALLKRMFAMIHPGDIIILNEVVSWHVMLSPPDLVAASIERNDVHTGSYREDSSFQSKLRRNAILDARVYSTDG